MHASPGELGGPRTLLPPLCPPLPPPRPRFPRQSLLATSARHHRGGCTIDFFALFRWIIESLSLFYVGDLVAGNVRPHDKDGVATKTRRTRLLYGMIRAVNARDVWGRGSFVGIQDENPRVRVLNRSKIFFSNERAKASAWSSSQFKFSGCAKLDRLFRLSRWLDPSKELGFQFLVNELLNVRDLKDCSWAVMSHDKDPSYKDSLVSDLTLI